MSAPWTHEQNERLRGLVELKVSNADIARIFGVTPQAITRHIRNLGLPTPYVRRFSGVAASRYKAMIEAIAAKHQLTPEAVERPRRKSFAASMRWRVWRELREGGASLTAIAKVAKVDVSSVHNATYTCGGRRA